MKRSPLATNLKRIHWGLGIRTRRGVSVSVQEGGLGIRTRRGLGNRTQYLPLSPCKSLVGRGPFGFRGDFASFRTSKIVHSSELFRTFETNRNWKGSENFGKTEF
jgi:hypothetical protein